MKHLQWPENDNWLSFGFRMQGYSELIMRVLISALVDEDDPIKASYAVIVNLRR